MSQAFDDPGGAKGGQLATSHPSFGLRWGDFDQFLPKG
jgi:hypothetical protein